MVDRFICILVLVGVPANILVVFLQLISMEVGMFILWGTVILAILVGVVEYVRNPDAYIRENS